MGDRMCLTEIMGGKRQENWRTHNWRLHRDIAPAHTALSLQPSLTESNMAVDNTLLPRPNPCDVFVFPKTTIPCKGQRFKDVPEIEAEIPAVLGKWTFQEMCVAVGQKCVSWK
jgi:hypothetical protein